MSPPSLGSKNVVCWKSTACCLRADFLLCHFLNPENGDDMFFLNVGYLPVAYTALYPSMSLLLLLLFFIIIGDGWDRTRDFLNTMPWCNDQRNNLASRRSRVCPKPEI
jgi:hypothetical protein